jgi:hypothetical protein
MQFDVISNAPAHASRICRLSVFQQNGFLGLKRSPGFETKGSERKKRCCNNQITLLKEPRRDVKAA